MSRQNKKVLNFYILKKISRESLTRGGSQDDPAQLLRDLQDSMEREADLREQLKFAEEEVIKKYYTSSSKTICSRLKTFEKKYPELRTTMNL